MTNQTKIEWCDYTINLVEGCQKVGPGCDFCYAEARNIRFKGDNWGPGKPRRKVKSGIPKLRKIQRGAADFIAANGRKPRVFPNSLSDLFDNAWETSWRDEGLAEFEASKDVDILMLTKRIGNVEKMVPEHWRNGHWPQNVGLMITIVNQAEANRDIPKLLNLKARLGIPWVGISYEPALGPIFPSLLSLGPGKYPGQRAVGDTYDALSGELVVGTSTGYERTKGGAVLDWIICGGESGPNARPMHPDWVRSLRDQCAAAGTPFLFKQWGEWGQAYYTVCPDSDMSRNKAVWLGWDGNQAKPSHHGLENPIGVIRIGKKRAGRMLDGVEHDGFPEALV